MNPYTVSVRTLCAFVAKQGDLDLRFTPSTTAQEGMAGHLEVTSRRGEKYRREISLQGTFGQLLVRGRADGYDPVLNRLEEIKTHRGALDRMPANHQHLHWGQARVYAWLLCEQMGLSGLNVALVYFDVDTAEETVLSEWHEAPALQQFFESMCGLFLRWAEQEMEHRARRDAAMRAMRFPHAEFRAGQRVLAEAVYRANVSGRCLLAQAPTGIGKTVATLFPVLKAVPDQKLDKVFFLTAKTPGRRLALDALQLIQQGAARPHLRVLEMVARDKACEHPGSDCHGESCPLAAGFYDRLPKAREAAAELAVLDRQALRTLALEHAVCPYYLGQEMLRWSDVVVGDYNHFFDVSALLHSLTLNEGWRVSILVDEAHNLVERGRRMYTAELDQDQFRTIRRTAPLALKKPFNQLHRCWNAMVDDQVEPYVVHAEVPDRLLIALKKLAVELTAYCAEHPAEKGLLQWSFDVLHFLRIAEMHGPHALFDSSIDVSPDGSQPVSRRSVLCLRNVIPAPLLKPRWAAAHSVTLFSATLSPPRYVLGMLGLPDSTVCLDVPSAFDSRQLEVRLAPHISTRFNDRRGSLDRLVALISEQYSRTPGNYLAYFSSFDYLRMAFDRLREQRPDIALWQQSRGMDENQRDAFLARFQSQGRGIGFAVLGGAFGEGIDLPGSRLIGAFIATLGLPQVNPVNEEMRRTVQQYMDHGYEYTYLYPGIQKVVQAAGRVIRTLQDTGVVYLIDDRFCRAELRELLPAWWDMNIKPAGGEAADSAFRLTTAFAETDPST